MCSFKKTFKVFFKKILIKFLLYFFHYTFLISVVIVYEPIFSQNFITINYPSLAFNSYTRGSYNFIIGKFVYGISL